jgi:hypothetical protein
MTRLKIHKLWISILLAALALACFAAGCRKNTPAAPSAPAATQTDTEGPSMTVTATSSAAGTATATGTYTLTGTDTVSPTITQTCSVTATFTITTTPTTTWTPFYLINALIRKDEAAGTIYTVTFLNNSTPVPDATVQVVNVELAGAHTLLYGNGMYSLSGEEYMYEFHYRVDVYYDGSTFSAQAMAPGQISFAPDGSQVSWYDDGDRESVTVTSPSGGTTYSVGPADLTSPQAIPPSAYPMPTVGTYHINVHVGNFLPSGFGIGGMGRMTIEDVNSYDVIKDTPSATMTSTASFTPTPTMTTGAVTIPDANFDAVIRAAVDKPAPTPVLNTDLAVLATLDASSAGITDLTGLEQCTNLTQFTCTGNSGLHDAGPIAGLKNLVMVNMTGNHLDSITPFTGLTNLEELDLGENNISSLTGIHNLTKLKYLALNNNPLNDVLMLQDMNSLITLDISNTNVHDLTGLETLTGLTQLTMDNLMPNDISSLEAMTSLTMISMKNIVLNGADPLSPLINNAAAGGLGTGDTVHLEGAALGPGGQADVDQLKAYGVTVYYP